MYRRIFFLILLSGVLPTGALAVRPAAQVNANSEAAAQQAIAAQHFAEARKIYEQLLKDAPANLTYRNWVARLSAWLKEYRRSVAVYDQSLAQAPDDFEALTGKALVLIWQNRFNEAAELLRHAEQNQDLKVAWHITMFSFYRAQGKAKLARYHIETACRLDPNNTEARTLSETPIPIMQPIAVHAGYEQQQLSTIAPNLPVLSSFFLDLAWQRTNGAVVLRIEQAGTTTNTKGSNRIGWSMYQKIGERLWLRGQTMFRTSASAASPQRDISLGAAYSLKGHIAIPLVVSNDYRRIRLDTINTHVLSPTLEVYQGERARWQVTLYRSWQSNIGSFSAKPYANELNAGWTLLARYDRQLTRNFKSSFTVTQGQQQPGNASSNSSQRSLAFGGSYQLTPRLGVSANYGRLWASTGTRQDSFGLSLGLR